MPTAQTPVVVGGLIYAKAEHMYQVDTVRKLHAADDRQRIPIDGLHENPSHISTY